MVMEDRLGCLLVLPCPTVHLIKTEAYFYPILLIACLPNLSLLVLPIFWLSYPFQCLGCNFSEAKTDFSLGPPCSEWHNIILLCYPLKSLSCAVGTYQLSWSQFLHHKHRIAFHRRSIGKPVPLWWNFTVAKTVILFNLNSWEPAFSWSVMSVPNSHSLLRKSHLSFLGQVIQYLSWELNAYK